MTDVMCTWHKKYSQSTDVQWLQVQIVYSNGHGFLRTYISEFLLHSCIFAGELLCNSYSNCTQQNTTARVSTTVGAVFASVLGVIVLVLLIVCTVALVVCLKRKQERMKREIIGNVYNYIIYCVCVCFLPNFFIVSICHVMENHLGCSWIYFVNKNMLLPR